MASSSLYDQIMAGATRLELAASGVTGRRYNQLNYAPANEADFMQKNRRNRDRTCDPRLVRPVLSQLSYPPTQTAFLIQIIL